MATGTVKCSNAEKGFGLIAPNEVLADFFANYTASSRGYRALEVVP